MEKKVLNVIAVFLLAWGLVALLVGCAPKKTAEVAPVVPSTKTDTTATMIQKCDEILKKSYGENIMTSVENGQYNIAIMEPGITSEIVYASGLAEGYNELCLNCKNAVGIDTILGVCDNYGNLVYVSFNGVDITGSI